MRVILANLPKDREYHGRHRVDDTDARPQLRVSDLLEAVRK